jgi:hypothetical protein
MNLALLDNGQAMKTFRDEPVLPCPFCGGEPELGVCEDENSQDFGGHFIQCTNGRCMASIGLIFACGDEPDPLLVERWNERATVKGRNAARMFRWVTIEANRVLYVDRGRDVILCDRGHRGPVTLVIQIEDHKMLLRRTEHVESYEDLCSTICWDEYDDPETALLDGVYAVCGGEWRREQDNQWRFWEDPILVAELAAEKAGAS